MAPPSKSVQGIASQPSAGFFATFTFKHVLFWAVLSTLTHLAIHSVESVEWDSKEPEMTALQKDIMKSIDKNYEFDFFYKWMVKEVKKDAARGEKRIERHMNWGKESKKHKPFSEKLARRMAKDVAAKLRNNGLDANARRGDVIVRLE